MTADKTTRNFDARPGEHLHDSVDLDGWDERSIWGYDARISSYYAQLWRNDSTGDAPDAWLSGAAPCYPWPGCMALAVVEATGHSPAAVVRALGLADPGPTLRSRGEIAQAIAPLPPAGGDAYTAGQLAALTWAAVGGPRTPGSWLTMPAREPTAEQVLAEHYMITGWVYRALDSTARAWVSGADEALAWVLSRG